MSTLHISLEKTKYYLVTLVFPLGVIHQVLSFFKKKMFSLAITRAVHPNVPKESDKF